jgi:uncharacterized protein YlxW (UPF0749 family)
MQTKDVSAELEQAMKKIQAQGKQPTVALVKAQLTVSVPMPAIIAAIKSWKGDRSVPKIEIADAEKKQLEKRVEELEKQVTELAEKLSKLEENYENLG